MPTGLLFLSLEKCSFLHIWKWPTGFKVQLFERFRLYFTCTMDLWVQAFKWYWWPVSERDKGRMEAFIHSLFNKHLLYATCGVVLGVPHWIKQTWSWHFNIPGFLFLSHLKGIAYFSYSKVALVVWGHFCCFCFVFSFIILHRLNAMFFCSQNEGNASRVVFSCVMGPQMGAREASALIPFLFIYTHKVDHCANSKTWAVKEDLPQAVLITGNDRDPESTNHREPHLRQWHGTYFPLIVDHNFSASNKHDRPEFGHP